jgi:hypothetical protein
VKELFALLEGAGLRFLRWCEPRRWSLAHLLGPGPLPEWLGALPLRVQYEIVERLAVRPALSFVASHREARQRPPPSPKTILSATLERNPQASLTTTQRIIGSSEIVESVTVRLRSRAPVALSELDAAVVCACACPTTGQDLVESACGSGGASREQAMDALMELLEREILFLP